MFVVLILRGLVSSEIMEGRILSQPAACISFSGVAQRSVLSRYIDQVVSFISEAKIPIK